jgi:hypothetical protein
MGNWKYLTIWIWSQKSNDIDFIHEVKNNNLLQLKIEIVEKNMEIFRFKQVLAHFVVFVLYFFSALIDSQFSILGSNLKYNLK